MGPDTSRLGQLTVAADNEDEESAEDETDDDADSENARKKNIQQPYIQVSKPAKT